MEINPERFNRLKAEDQEYLLNALAQTLHRAGQRRRLYALIDRSWMELKRGRFGSHRPFAEDVDVAVAMALADPSPAGTVQFIRTCTLSATLREQATQVPAEVLAALAAVGRAETALGYAALIRLPEYQARAYRLIAEALLTWGDTGRALGTLSRAADSAAAIGVPEVSNRAMALSQVARSFGRAGARSKAAEVARQALEAASALSQDWDQAIALAEIAPALAEADQKDELEAVHKRASQIGSDWYRAWTLSAVAQAWAQAGETDRAGNAAQQAWAAAQALGPGSSRSTALSAAARALAWAGTEAAMASKVARQALATALVIGDGWMRSAALVDAASALAAAGDRSQAQSAAGQIPVRWSMAKALGEVSEALLRRGQRSAAIQAAIAALPVLATVEEEIPRIERTMGERMGVAKTMDPSRGTVSAAVVQAENGRAEALAQVVQVLAQMGQLDRLTEALTVAGSIGNRWNRSQALGIVATALARAGAEVLAADTAERALRAGQVADHQLGLAYLLVSLADALFERGEPARATQLAAQARDVAHQVGEAPDRCRALLRAARVLARHGRAVAAKEATEQALAAIEALTDRQALARTLSDAAQVLGELKAGSTLARLVAAAQAIPDQCYRAQALGAIAVALARMGETEQARELAGQALTTEGHADAVDRPNLLSSSALALAITRDRAGLDHVVQAANAIESEAYRVQALGQIVEAFALAGDAQGVVHALSLASASTDELWRAEAVEGAARSLVRAGQPLALDALQAAADRLTNSTYRLNALGEVGYALARLGEWERAAGVVASLLAALGPIEDGRFKSAWLGRAAQILAEMGEQERTGQTAQAALAAGAPMGDSWYGQDAALWTMEALGKAGLYAEMVPVWKRRVSSARLSGTRWVWSCVGEAAPYLAAMDGSHTLWQIYWTLMEVEDWWKTQPTYSEGGNL